MKINMKKIIQEQQKKQIYHKVRPIVAPISAAYSRSMGGISYETGDFVTPGTSGFGFIQNLLTPEVKQSLVGSAKDSAKEMVGFIYQEYKTPIWAAVFILSGTLILSTWANFKVITKG